MSLPNIKSIDNTPAVFQTSTITYSSSSTTYNKTTTKYGGSDRKVDKKPVMMEVINL